MEQRILVVNPNCLTAVTQSMSAALDEFRLPGAPDIRCETLETGPAGIETQAHVDDAAVKLAAWFMEKSGKNRADAYVIACFSDPGVLALREILKAPVYGIGEASYLAAAALGGNFGVIAIVSKGIARHARTQRALGLEHKVAGEIAIDLPVAELGKEELVWKRMSAVGARLRDEHGAQSIIMGCAGMARYRNRLEDHLGVPVIDPTQVAVGMAMSQLLAKRTAAAEKRAAA
ncbi:MAG: aspartate/glutamate racemase family protein [Burkholderiales bacterium]